MRGQPQVSTARLPTRTSGRSWFSRIKLAIRSRGPVSPEQLELIERLSREQRRARRAGEYVPDLGRLPRPF
jgi:hypothetical protein